MEILGYSILALLVLMVLLKLWRDDRSGALDDPRQARDGGGFFGDGGSNGGQGGGGDGGA